MPMPNGNVKPPRKTESIALRVEKNILDEMRNDAEQKMESLNTSANQVLKSYVTRHKPAAKAGNYYVTKTLFIDIFETMTEEQIAQIAENWVKKHSKDVVVMINKGHDLESF